MSLPISDLMTIVEDGSDAQSMEKLRQVVSDGDPKAIYRKIKPEYVSFFFFSPERPPPFADFLCGAVERLGVCM
jgi:hypothetical protein